MDIVNIIIIALVVVVLVVIILVIANGLRKVDEKTLKELETDSKQRKKRFFSRLKKNAISFFEVVVRVSKRNIQRCHSWIMKAKRQEDDILRVEEDLAIDNVDNQKEDVGAEEGGDIDDVSPPKKGVRISDFVGRFSKNKVDGNVIREVSVDSISENKGKDITTKKSLMNSLFGVRAKRNKLKNVIDIRENVSEKWSLVDAVGSGDSDTNSDPGKYVDEIKLVEPGRNFRHTEREQMVDEYDDDALVGVDLGIFEKNILQKITKEPKDLDNYKQLGNLYIKMERFDEAIEVFEHILSISPRDVFAIRKIKKAKFLKRLQGKKDD